MRRLSVRRAWRTLHLALALIVGAGFALIGSTGALLVLKGPLVALEVGQAIVKPPLIADEPEATADVWIERASQRYPELKVIGANAPGEGFMPGDAAVVFGRLPKGDLGVVFVHRQSGAPLGLFAFDRSFFAGVVDLHRRLLLPGPFGASVVGWCGIGLVLSLLSGAYLWWPRQRKWWRSLRISRRGDGRRRLIEWHGVSAAYLLAPMLVVAATGVALTKPQWLGLSGAAPARSVAARSPASACPAGSDLRGALAAAAQARPDARIVGVLLPRGPDGAYRVNLLSPPSRRGDLSLDVRVGCGSPVVEVTDQGGPALRRDWLNPLHADLGLGLPGSVIVFLCGIALPALYVTGLWLWLARRRPRRD